MGCRETAADPFARAGSAGKTAVTFVPKAFDSIVKSP